MIIKKLKQSLLFKNTFIYTFLQLINKGIPFFLLPILTHYLSTDDFGMIAAYNTFLGGVAIFIGLSMSGAVGVNYFQMEQGELRNYIGNVFHILFVSTVIMIVIVSLFNGLLAQHLEIPLEWMYIAVIVALMQNITAINLTLWRSQQRAKPYALYEIAETVFNITISLLLVIALKYGWEGRTSGTATAAIIFGILSLFIIYKRGYASVNYSVKYMKDALKFGVPLLPHHLALWMRTGVDIILITSLVGVAETGIYSVGYQLGAVVGIIAMAFNNAYSPYLFEKLKDMSSDDKAKIVKFTYLYFVGIIFLALSLSTFFSMIIPYFLSEAFQEAGIYIFWISLAYAFQGMYLMVGLYIFYVKKTHLLSSVTISTSIIHVLLSYVLINIFGAIGAAYATVSSFFLTFILVWYLGSKVYKMPWFGQSYIDINKNGD
ncbi:MAG: oligosaccharide flippase family protein [Campylobacterota bacterium]|nr:oligosaccharide flippase family protein [Campylobacterota bacterium]